MLYPISKIIPTNAGINMNNIKFRPNTLLNAASINDVKTKNTISLPFIDFAIFSNLFLYLPVSDNTPYKPPTANMNRSGCKKNCIAR